MLYKCIMANASAILQQAAHATYQLSSQCCSARAIQKSLTLNERYQRVFWKKKSGEWTISRKMTRQNEQEDQVGKKNKRGDRKEESNDSPEIPDRRETSDIPGLTSGWEKNNNKCADSLIIVNYFMFNRLLLIILYLKPSKARQVISWGKHNTKIPYTTLKLKSK